MSDLSRRNFLHGSALIGVSVAAAAMTPMAAYEIKSCLILLLIACAGATPFPAMWVQRLKNANMWKKSGWLLQSCYILTGLVLATAFLLGSSVHPFLYFRF